MTSEVKGPRSWQLPGRLQPPGALYTPVGLLIELWHFSAGWRSGPVFYLPRALNVHRLVNQTRCGYFLNRDQGSDFTFKIFTLGGLMEKQEKPIRNQHLFLWFQGMHSDPQHCTTSLLFTATETEVSAPTPRQQDVGAESCSASMSFYTSTFWEAFFPFFLFFFWETLFWFNISEKLPRQFWNLSSPC